jgi:hypothetical protein
LETLDLDHLEVEISGVLENQSTKVDDLARLYRFFSGRYLVFGEPHLVQRTIIDGDKIYTG